MPSNRKRQRTGNSGGPMELSTFVMGKGKGTWGKTEAVSIVQKEGVLSGDNFGERMRLGSRGHLPLPGEHR